VCLSVESSLGFLKCDFSVNSGSTGLDYGSTGIT
jgi:hypothetical protein